jgi:hypothetical protein
MTVSPLLGRPMVGDEARKLIAIRLASKSRAVTSPVDS